MEGLAVEAAEVEAGVEGGCGGEETGDPFRVTERHETRPSYCRCRSEIESSDE